MKESQLQESIIKLSKLMSKKYGGLSLLHHIPNGGKRNMIEAVKFKRMGVLSGIPDLFLPVAKNGFHGLYVELKTGKGKLSDNQTNMICDLENQGYKVAIVRSIEQFKETIESYYA